MKNVSYRIFIHVMIGKNKHTMNISNKHTLMVHNIFYALKNIKVEFENWYGNAFEVHNMKIYK